MSQINKECIYRERNEAFYPQDKDFLLEYVYSDYCLNLFFFLVFGFSFYGHVKLAFMFLSNWTLWFSPNCGDYFPYPVTRMQFNRLLIVPFLEYKRIR